MPKKLSLAQPSSDLTNRMILNLFGPRAAGKTWAAFSLSKKWPKNPTQNKKKIILDDVIYWQWDPDGAVGLAPHKIGLKYVFNMPSIIADKGLPEALTLVCAEADEIAYDDPNVAVEIHDTVTTFDSYSLAYLEGLPGDRDGTMIKDNPRRLFGMHLGHHRQYQTETVMRPDRVSSIYLFHEKAMDVDMILKDGKATKAAKSKARQRVMEDTSRVHIVPETTGAGDKYYANACSMEVSISATPVPGKKNEFKRLIHPVVHDGRRSKSRFQTLFTEPLPADLKVVRDRFLAATK